MKLRCDKIWVFTALCNPPTHKFLNAETPCSKTWRLLGCGPPLDGKIISVSEYNLMSIPIDPISRLYVYVRFSCCIQHACWKIISRFVFSDSKDRLFIEIKQGNWRKNLQLPCFLTFRKTIRLSKQRKTLLCQKEFCPKSRVFAHRLTGQTWRLPLCRLKSWCFGCWPWG